MTARPRGTERLAVNAVSKAHAEHDGEEWTAEQLEWLQSWDGTEEYLRELAELLGRTIEACRERYYVRRRTGDWSITTTKTIRTQTTVTYRGWTEDQGDGW